MTGLCGYQLVMNSIPKWGQSSWVQQSNLAPSYRINTAFYHTLDISTGETQGRDVTAAKTNLQHASKSWHAWCVRIWWRTDTPSGQCPGAEQTLPDHSDFQWAPGPAPLLLSTRPHPGSARAPLRLSLGHQHKGLRGLSFSPQLSVFLELTNVVFWSKYAINITNTYHWVVSGVLLPLG